MMFTWSWTNGNGREHARLYQIAFPSPNAAASSNLWCGLSSRCRDLKRSTTNYDSISVRAFHSFSVTIQVWAHVLRVLHLTVPHSSRAVPNDLQRIPRRVSVLYCMFDKTFNNVNRKH